VHLRSVEAAGPAGRNLGLAARDAALMPSTVIKRFAYDRGTQALEVVFVTGRRYLYHNVPEDVAAAMRLAFAKGEFFNAEIRDRYRFTRLEPSGESERKVTE
jgi:hypothetical protein